MKIAILGTKGIPNNYGGFEQFAEYISVGLAELGHSITVYNPTYHPYKGDCYKGVNITRVFSPEKILGSAANFIYDHLCLKHALKQEFDIIYEAGYHSVAFSFWILGVKKISHPVFLTNMDGLEWKREKWNYLTRKLIKRLERIAVRNSHYLVSDNVGIQDYYKRIFNKDSFYLPYGATIPTIYDQTLLANYAVEPNNYFIVIARLEPENNIETIINGFYQSTSTAKLLIIGGLNRFGRVMCQRYQDRRISFTGGVYNKMELDSLRHFSMGYFHGHSVGGTNPSLLEAMASECFIMAHENPFNKAILEDNASYFTSAQNITDWIHSIKSIQKVTIDRYKSGNIAKIRGQFSWQKVIKDHESLFSRLLP